MSNGRTVVSWLCKIPKFLTPEISDRESILHAKERHA